MLIRVRQRARAAIASAPIAIVLLALPSVGYAQERQPSFLAHTVKGVVLDPTTYAPAAIAYHATMKDWNSSQPFFLNGYREHNERYSISGRPNDLPLSYADGQRRILKDALMNLEVSVVSNTTSRVLERALMNRYPEHRKVVRTIGWIQRIAFGSYYAYRLAAPHYRQAADNERRAVQLGFR